MVQGALVPGSNPGWGHCVVFLDKTLTSVSLSTQEYKLVSANCCGNLTNCGGLTRDGLASHPEGVEILPAASCLRHMVNLRQPCDSWLQGFSFGNRLERSEIKSSEFYTLSWAAHQTELLRYRCNIYFPSRQFVVSALSYNQWVTG